MHVINGKYFIEVYSLKEEVCAYRTCRIVAIRSVNIIDYVLDVELTSSAKEKQILSDVKPSQVVKTISV